MCNPSTWEAEAQAQASLRHTAGFCLKKEVVWRALMNETGTAGH
jgi:hypothetical protein